MVTRAGGTWKFPSGRQVEEAIDQRRKPQRIMIGKLCYPQGNARNTLATPVMKIRVTKVHKEDSKQP